MENITLEDVRSRAEAYYMAVLDGIDVMSHSRECGGCSSLDDYLDEQRRAAHMIGFIIGFNDAEIDGHIMRHMKGGDSNDHD